MRNIFKNIQKAFRPHYKGQSTLAVATQTFAVILTCILLFGFVNFDIDYGYDFVNMFWGVCVLLASSCTLYYLKGRSRLSFSWTPLMWLPAVLCGIAFAVFSGANLLEGVATIAALFVLNAAFANFFKSDKQMFLFNFTLVLAVSVFILGIAKKAVTGMHALISDGLESYNAGANYYMDFASGGMVGLIACAVLPIAVIAIVARKFTIERRALAVVMFGLLWYGISRCAGWSVLICASWIVLVIPYMFAVNRKDFITYFALFSLLVAGTWIAFLCEFYYTAKFFDYSFTTIFNGELAAFYQMYLPMLSDSTATGSLGGKEASCVVSLAGFVLGYGWVFSLTIAVPIIFIWTRLALNFRRLALAVDTHGLPIARRADVHQSLLRREARTRTSLLFTPDERIFAGASIISLSAFIFVFIFSDVSLTVQIAAVLAAILSAAQIAMSGRRMRVGENRLWRVLAGVFCILVAALFFAQLSQKSVLWLAYQETQKVQDSGNVK